MDKFLLHLLPPFGSITWFDVLGGITGFGGGITFFPPVLGLPPLFDRLGGGLTFLPPGLGLPPLFGGLGPALLPGLPADLLPGPLADLPPGGPLGPGPKLK